VTRTQRKVTSCVKLNQNISGLVLMSQLEYPLCFWFLTTYQLSMTLRKNISVVHDIKRDYLCYPWHKEGISLLYMTLSENINVIHDFTNEYLCYPWKEKDYINRENKKVNLSCSSHKEKISLLSMTLWKNISVFHSFKKENRCCPCD